MIDYIYAIVVLVAIYAVWDCWRRFIAHRERIQDAMSVNALNALHVDLDETKKRLADVITAVNLAKLQSRGVLGRRIGEKP